jgi:hypothetical protein
MLYAVGFILLVVAEIYYFILLYRIWKFAIESSARCGLVPSVDTPGKAVGYCFIPFYSFYWVFVALGSLPNNLNAVAEAQNKIYRLSGGLGISVALFGVLSVIPFLNIITGLVGGFILVPIFISRAFNMCKDLSVATAEGSAHNEGQ